MHIVMYTKHGCNWCNEVRDLLKEKGVAFEEREVLSNPTYYDELVAVSGQELTPTLVIDGKDILKDSDKDQVAAYMKEKGIAGFS